MPENVSMIGYARVSKADGSQVHHLQHDALIAAGVDPKRIYQDSISGARDSRPGLDWRPGTRWRSRSSTGSAAAFAIWSTPSVS